MPGEGGKCPVFSPRVQNCGGKGRFLERGIDNEGTVFSRVRLSLHSRTEFLYLGSCRASKCVVIPHVKQKGMTNE